MASLSAQKVHTSNLEAPEDIVGAALLGGLDCLRTAITMYDADERLIYANQHFDYLFRGLPARARLMGCAYGEIVALEAPELADDMLRDGLDAFVAERRAQLTDGDFRPRDIHLADGRILEIKSRRAPNGGWIVLWSDVTHARASYARLEAAIEMSADAFAFFDARDRLVVCNKEYAALHGRAVEEMRGAEFAALVREAVQSGRVRVESGTEAWIERRLDLHRSTAGAMTLEMRSGEAYLVRDRRTADGHVCVLTDITDERRTEAALAEQSQTLAKTRAELAHSRDAAEKQATYLADLAQRLDAAAQSVDTTKKTLLRTMSHELKTPLNAIIGFSDLLGQMAERFSHDQVREYAGLIHAGGNNLLRLINHILDLTKLAGGKYEPQRRAIDVGSALWNARDVFDERAAAKSMTIDAGDCPIGFTVDADEHAFEQIVNHLVDNAVSYGREGGTIRLSVERAGARVRLRICDDGPGVAAEDLQRILEPFEQGGRSTIDHSHGTGLGLTLAKAFAELHGGTLAIASTAGEGFTATVELPAP
ncbi:MAG: PAS-domain containing protein [Proteobacteria bacterium]|nr:PAS-domain containing protein [Pseudomonadota bacterium]